MVKDQARVNRLETEKRSDQETEKRSDQARVNRLETERRSDQAMALEKVMAMSRELDC
jgi:hypothetical protein